MCQIHVRPSLYALSRFILTSHSYSYSSSVCSWETKHFPQSNFRRIRKAANDGARVHTHRHTLTSACACALLNFTVLVPGPKRERGIITSLVWSCSSSRASEGRVVIKNTDMCCCEGTTGIFPLASGRLFFTYKITCQADISWFLEERETTVLHNTHQQCWFCRASDQK